MSWVLAKSIRCVEVGMCLFPVLWTQSLSRQAVEAVGWLFGGSGGFGRVPIIGLNFSSGGVGD